MNVNLTIIKRLTPVDSEEIAAIGEVTLESAMEWIGEMRSASGTVEVIDAPEGNLDLSCAVYLPPAGKSLMQFQLINKAPAASWEYRFSGDHGALDQLVDHFAVLEAREGLPQTS
jgi:hypothetical protein